jgi:hypothetical protein
MREKAAVDEMQRILYPILPRFACQWQPRAMPNGGRAGMLALPVGSLAAAERQRNSVTLVKTAELSAPGQQRLGAEVAS